METEKQIEEMAKIVCNACEMGNGFDGECATGNDYKKCGISVETAKALYDAGYRKASEVVGEISRMLREDLRGFVDASYLERLLTIYEKKYTEGAG